ncbi:MAG: hypothetical protein IEMM0008_0230 [bacterium]|nr:MAG: hypothetical protein IEMM0008_0230 [bacterium]
MHHFIFNIKSILGLSSLRIPGGLGDFTGPMTINITLSSFHFNALALGNLILLPALFSLRKTAFRDTLISFINLTIFFLFFETSLLLLHLSFKYPPLYAELLFYSKFTILLGFYYWIGRDNKNTFLTIVWWTAGLILIGIILTLLTLIYSDYQFLFSFARFQLSGRIRSILSLNQWYQQSISILVYLQHVLPLIFFALNIIIMTYFYTNKEKIFSRYYKIIKRLQDKYQNMDQHQDGI